MAFSAPAAIPRTSPKRAAAVMLQWCSVYMIAVAVPLRPMIEATEKSNSPTQKAHSSARLTSAKTPAIASQSTTTA